MFTIEQRISMMELKRSIDKVMPIGAFQEPTNSTKGIFLVYVNQASKILIKNKNTMEKANTYRLIFEGCRHSKPIKEVNNGIKTGKTTKLFNII
jgi:hypothetical protein